MAQVKATLEAAKESLDLQVKLYPGWRMLGLNNIEWHEWSWILIMGVSPTNLTQPLCIILMLKTDILSVGHNLAYGTIWSLNTFHVSSKNKIIDTTSYFTLFLMTIRNSCTRSTGQVVYLFAVINKNCFHIEYSISKNEITTVIYSG